jgi:hypothetical protein
VFASCLRVYFVYKYFNSPDPAFDTIEVRISNTPYKVIDHQQANTRNTQVLLWSQIELNVAIICSSIASLRPLFKSAFGGGSGPRSGGALRYKHNGTISGLSSSHYRHDFELATNEAREGRPNTKIEAQIRSMDNDSQEYILNPGDDAGIKRTIETSVTSEEIARGRFIFDKEGGM